MKDKTLLGGLIVMGVGVILIGIVWTLFLQPDRTPSEPLSAIPIELAVDSADYTIFEINSTESDVTFSLDEVLRGLPTIVNGSSRQVAGQIAVNFENPSSSQIGPILINARTLATDNEFRDKAIHSFILDTDVYEQIIFEPTQIQGLPDQFVTNEPIAIQLEGNLTVREITRKVSFAGTVTANGRTSLTGSASTVINRSDFQLEIPNAPGVANVSEEVSLTIHFVAQPAN